MMATHGTVPRGPVPFLHGGLRGVYQWQYWFWAGQFFIAQFFAHWKAVIILSHVTSASGILSQQDTHFQLSGTSPDKNLC